MTKDVKSGLLEFSDDQKVFVAVDEDDDVKKAVLIDREGNETALGALPTDEQVQEAVDAWLDDHPEATTTVQDGAITTAKLANGSVTDDKLAADGIKAEVSDLKTDLDNRFKGRGLLTNSDDLDNITTDGLYSWASASIPSHSPINFLGNMLVFKNTVNGTTKVIQIVPTTDDDFYYRVKNTSSFGAWVELTSKQVLLYATGLKGILLGADIHWTSGKTISSNGTITSSAYNYMSDEYTIPSGVKYLKLNDNILDSSNFPYNVFIAEYAGSTFKRRTFVSGEDVFPHYVKLGLDTTKVRFVMGYSSSHGVTPTSAMTDSFYMLLCDTLNIEGASNKTGQITHAVPESDGQLNVVRRARQFTDIKWTPLFDIPRRSCMCGNYNKNYPDTDIVFEDVFKAGVEYQGIPYARADYHASNWGYSDMKVGWTVDFETFISAVRNPESVVAKESVYNEALHDACFYATICAALVSYAFDLSRYYTTLELSTLSSFNKIGTVSTMNLSLIKMGQMLNDPTLHCCVISDVIYDENGSPLFVEIAEAGSDGNDNWNMSMNNLGGGGQYGGVCCRHGYDITSFVQNFGSYGVYNYSGIANVTYTPSPYVNTGDELNMTRVYNFPCVPYMGEGFKYKYGHVYNSKILTPAYKANELTKLRVKKDGVNWKSDNTTDYYDVSGAYVEVGFADKGEYEAYLCKVVDGDEVSITKSCHWSVID